MFDRSGSVLYVGKAKNLRKRLASYFRQSGLSPKTIRLVDQIHAIETVVTHTEGEALILENRLIKQHTPKYNILLRDDKSFPYILFDTSHRFPTLRLFRGYRRKSGGRYFGPYPSSSAVRFTLHHLYRVFKIRQCSDTFFANRSRPCLQFQINRCTAPCVGRVTAEQYAEQVNQAVRFLKGEGDALQKELIEAMDRAAKEWAFEKAAQLRDQIAALSQIQEKQFVEGASGDLDVLGVAVEGNQACIQLFSIRKGQNLGSRPFYPKIPEESSVSEIVAAFISQYYADNPLPGEILLSAHIEDVAFIETELRGGSGRKVRVYHPAKGARRRWWEMAQQNAHEALRTRIGIKEQEFSRFRALQAFLGMAELPNRIEGFDISHTQGQSTVASCVACGPEGLNTSRYRRFSIRGITPGDDYAAMDQVLTRHFVRMARDEPDVLPAVVLIDGGKGQLAVACDVLSRTVLAEQMPILLSIGKGPERVAATEQFYRVGSQGEIIEVFPPEEVANLLRRVRDESHRFAITGHRKQRAKTGISSPLDTIEGLGPAKRQSLLKSFGGLQGIARAGVEDLIRVDGIGKKLAELIYERFHQQER
jgi:excinuclease ABC subunit C